MTLLSDRARRSVPAALVALLALLFALSACSGSGSEEALDEAPNGTKEVVDDRDDDASDAADDGDGEGGSEADTNDDDAADSPDTTDVAAPDSEDDGTTSTTMPDDDPLRPPGTVNDLDDLIGNESDDGLQSTGGGSLVDRFVQALIADPGDVPVTETDARCAGELLEADLSATSFELLVTNLEMFNEIEEGTQFTDAELLVITDSLASCIDFRPVVQEVVDDDQALGSLVGCLAANLDVDAVESLLLFELISENGQRVRSPLVLTGFDLCPTQARTVVDNLILREFLLDDAPRIEACLADINNAELRPFFETVELGELIRVLREQCLF